MDASLQAAIAHPSALKNVHAAADKVDPALAQIKIQASIVKGVELKKVDLDSAEEKHQEAVKQGERAPRFFLSLERRVFISNKCLCVCFLSTAYLAEKAAQAAGQE